MKLAHLALVLIASGVCLAQTVETLKEAPRHYQLDFILKDLEAGKVLTTHNYSMIVASGSRSQLRAGSKVYVESLPFDVGANIDCSGITELHDQLTFELTGEVSSLLPDNGARPVVRQNKWTSNVIVTLKKPTVVFSSDDNTTKRVLQLEVTATPLRN